MQINSISNLTLTGLVFLLGFSASYAGDLPTKNQARANAIPAGFNLWVSPGLFSYHFDRNAGYRELNWGFGVQSDVSEDWSVLAGNFINSDYARSNYAGLAWQPLSWHAVKIGAVVGAFDGYPAMRNGGGFLAAMPWASIRGRRIGLNLTVVPNYSNRLHGALSGQLIFRVW